jgi:hypothetical protein
MNNEEFYDLKEHTVAKPSDVTWKCWVQCTGGDKHARVDNAWRSSRDTHDETDGHDTQTCKYEWVPLSEFVARIRNNDSKNRGCDVNWDG